MWATRTYWRTGRAMVNQWETEADARAYRERILKAGDCVGCDCWKLP